MDHKVWPRTRFYHHLKWVIGSPACRIAFLNFCLAISDTFISIAGICNNHTSNSNIEIYSWHIKICRWYKNFKRFANTLRNLSKILNNIFGINFSSFINMIKLKRTIHETCPLNRSLLFIKFILIFFKSVPIIPTWRRTGICILNLFSLNNQF